jgi:sortase A
VTTTQESGDIIDLRTAPPAAPVVADREIDDPAHATNAPAAVTAAAPREAGAGAEKRASRGDVGGIISRGLTIFSLLVAAMIAFLFVFSGFAEARTQVGLRRRFQNDLSNLRAPIGGVIDNGTPVAELDIPAIGVHQIVVQGTTSGALRDGPGHLRQSPLPGQEGNAVIFGRRSAYGAPFRHLSSLKPGDHIAVWTGEGQRTYIVAGVHTARAGNGAELVSDGSNALTLVTSDPAFLASGRLIVTAHLVGAPFAPSADPTPVTRAELGLAGETDGILPLVLWLEVLLIVAVGATWLWRRWTRWSAYLVCVPVVFAITWIVFENVTKLLPATL